MHILKIFEFYARTAKELHEVESIRQEIETPAACFASSGPGKFSTVFNFQSAELVFENFE